MPVSIIDCYADDYVSISVSCSLQLKPAGKPMNLQAKAETPERVTPRSTHSSNTINPLF